jgi:hypothetical protein
MARLTTHLKMNKAVRHLFLWLAFNAPHTPFHVPPTELHNRELSGTESDIAALAGVNVNQVNDSISFENLLSEEQEFERFIQYSEQSSDSGEEWNQTNPCCSEPIG